MIDIEAIRKDPENQNWFNISDSPGLTEDFIEEFADKIYWDEISFTQKLSEDFIRKYQDKLDWYYISWFQSLSKSFIEEFIDKISINLILANPNTSDEVKEFCRIFI